MEDMSPYWKAATVGRKRVRHAYDIAGPTRGVSHIPGAGRYVRQCARGQATKAGRPSGIYDHRYLRNIGRRVNVSRGSLERCTRSRALHSPA